MGTRIAAWGTALPDKTITNADLEDRLDTSDDWITERTGIKERRVGDSTVNLAVEAGARALAAWGGDPADVDLLVLATTTPDKAMPASASAVQQELGLSCGAFDLNAACSGFVYALTAAYGFAAIGSRTILVIGADTLSRLTDWDDRGTAILFGDGAGAVVLEPSERSDQLLAWDVGSDGAAGHILFAELGSTMQMDGREVFRRAVRVMVASAKASLARAGVDAADVALVVPHQANIRIIESACAKLGIPMERVANVLERTGNTSAGSIPLALADALDAGRVADGDKVLLVGFGAGMTWASALLEWQGDVDD